MQVNDSDNFEERMPQRLPIIIAMIISGIVIILMVSSGLKLAESTIKTYNEIVALQEDTKFAFSMVQSKMQDRLLKIPDLVTVTKDAAIHAEKVTANLNSSSENLQTLLESGDINEIAEADIELSKAVNNMVVLIGKNSNITASNQFSDLMAEISGCVNRISNARTNYNSMVRKYNTKIKQFPGKMIANMCGFEEISEFEADPEAAKLSLVDWNDLSTLNVLESN